jgi:hypothetical protein
MDIPIYMTIQKMSINHNQSNIFSLASLHVLQHKKLYKNSVDSIFVCNAAITNTSILEFISSHKIKVKTCEQKVKIFNVE